MKIAVIIGTKAELIKMIPVLKEFEKRGIDYVFIHTGQHKIDKIIKEFGVKNPDFVLYLPPRYSSKFMVKTHRALFWFLPLIIELNKVLKVVKPDFVLFHGDTLSSAAAAISSSTIFKKKTWKNVHLEAGLRSFDIFEPFPEEISRIICDRFSDILFAVSELSVKNLMREKVKGEIIKVGNTIIDSVYLALKIAKKKKIRKIKEKKYVVVTIHRHENIKSKIRMKKIVEIVKSVSLPIYWPLHDNTKKQLIRFGLWKKIEKNIKFSPLISYVHFIQLLRNSTYILTDGGSIQEESLVLKKPCLLLRMRTERQEGLKTKINFLTKLNVDYAKKIIEMLEMEKFKIPKFKNPYGKKGVSKKIVKWLEKMF